MAFFLVFRLLYIYIRLYTYMYVYIFLIALIDKRLDRIRPPVVIMDDKM